MSTVWSHLAISRDQVVAVVVATCTLYLVFVVMLRVWGRHVRASTSTTSVAAATVMGSLVGRSMLGDVPDLSGGLVAFATLVLLETAFRQLRGRRAPVAPPRPLAVVVDGVPREGALRAADLTGASLAVLLRRAGVTRMADVALAVLETDGRLTVVPAGAAVDAALVEDVEGAHDLPGTIVRREPA